MKELTLSRLTKEQHDAILTRRHWRGNDDHTHVMVMDEGDHVLVLCTLRDTHVAEHITDPSYALIAL